ncbi:MAG: hypothetical protein HY858_04080 [Candidatus Solibacter usitatus]|nr:hypothetical protein [Candidatus Solibacter usitatus]
MDIGKMLGDLRQERTAIEEAILTLERLARGHVKRRGRPPAWMVALREKEAAPAAAAPKRRGRPPKSASQSD